MSRTVDRERQIAAQRRGRARQARQPDSQRADTPGFSTTPATSPDVRNQHTQRRWLFLALLGVAGALLLAQLPHAQLVRHIASTSTPPAIVPTVVLIHDALHDAPVNLRSDAATPQPESHVLSQRDAEVVRQVTVIDHSDLAPVPTQPNAAAVLALMDATLRDAARLSQLSNARRAASSAPPSGKRLSRSTPSAAPSGT